MNSEEFLNIPDMTPESPPEMRTVTIRFYKGTSPIAWAIRWQSRGVYSHVAIIVEGVQYEALEFSGVIQTSASAKPDNCDDYEVEVTASQLSLIKSFLRRQLSKGYDYLAIARFVSRRKAGAWSDDRWFCSELVYAALDNSGIELFQNTKAWEVSPSLLSKSPTLKLKK